MGYTQQTKDTTSGADIILDEKGTLVVPDILANAGGVVVSYFEWLQNRAGTSWTLGEVRTRLEKTMLEAFNQIYGKMESLQCDFRTAAYVEALERINKAVESQGTYSYYSHQ